MYRYCSVRHQRVAVASMQRALWAGNSLAFRNQKSYTVGDRCNRKGIQPAYFQYNSDISKCKRSLFARCRAPSTLLASSSLNRYVDANSSKWRHSFVTFVLFKRYFYSIKITLATERLINIDILLYLTLIALATVSAIPCCTVISGITLSAGDWNNYDWQLATCTKNHTSVDS